MTRTYFGKKILALVGMAALLAAWSLGVTTTTQGALVRHSTGGDLFYDHYVPPVGCNGVGAKLNPCPRPTPPLVGHTNITYQPLMPSEMLYKHHRVYKTQHDDAFRTRTSVRWR
jgi:hypothetical protein